MVKDIIIFVMIRIDWFSAAI